MNQTLLIEVLTEELPPKALTKLGEAFASGVLHGLTARDLIDADAVVTLFATPRRLAVGITRVRQMALAKTLREKVLPVAVALDAAGNATPPLLKKLAALAAASGTGTLTLNDLERAIDGKAESFFYNYQAPGVALGEALQGLLDEAIAKLPIPKVMSYQRPDGSTVQFVRPVHSVIALHGAAIVPLTLFGLASDRVTLGHRFLSHGTLAIADADCYAATLASVGKVIANPATRKEKIRAALLAAAGDDQVLMPEALLDEVSALVEWPMVYACHFEEEFLTVPQECLILTMQTNQKYFALTDSTGRLRSRFLIVSNIETSDPQHIIGGNERVVRPRLSDAKFFFEQDQKKTLESRLPGLASVVYHNRLGTQLQRTERVAALAGKIAAMLGSDGALAQRAARLAKTDLLTDMVGEFPELQGIMGTYYARHDGEHDDVALAISEHYQPRFAGDALPSSVTGTIVALADKLETLVGIWGIGLQPTGDKDPFALRRHALGILRMLIEKRLRLDLVALLHATQDVFPAELLAACPRKRVDGMTPDAGILATDKNFSIFDFIIDRLSSYLRDKAYSPQAVAAVLKLDPTCLDTVFAKLDAVKAFAALPDAEALAAANKRITNILKKSEGSAGTAVDPALLPEAAERSLYAAMVELTPHVNAAYAAGDFSGTLKALAQLREPVDGFFNDVMVMADDAALRANRLALLSQLHAMMNRVADISKLAV